MCLVLSAWLRSWSWSLRTTILVGFSIYYVESLSSYHTPCRWRLRLTSTHEYDTLTLLRRSTMSQKALLYKIIVLYFRYCFSVLSYRSDLALDCLRPECTSRLKVNITILISIKCVYWNGAEIRWASQPTWVYPPKQNTILLLITKRYSNERHLWFGFYFSSQLRSSYYIRSILSIYCIYPPRHNNYCMHTRSRWVRVQFSETIDANGMRSCRNRIKWSLK